MESATATQFFISKAIELAGLEQQDWNRCSSPKWRSKMLQFTELHPPLPDIYEVAAKFEHAYESHQYEAEVATLRRNARNRDRERSPDRDQQSKDALDALEEEDHSILLMAGQAFRLGSGSGSSRLRDFLIYVAVGIGVVLIVVLVVAFSSRR